MTVFISPGFRITRTGYGADNDCTGTGTEDHLVFVTYGSSSYSQSDDDKQAEQRRREREFIRLFAQGPAPIVPRFNTPRFWSRPEHHARSHPRPAALRPRRQPQREPEEARNG